MDVGSRVYYIDEGPEDTGTVIGVKRSDDHLTQFWVHWDTEDEAPSQDNDWYAKSQLEEI